MRPEAPADHPCVLGLNRRAFGGDAEARIVEALRRAGRPTISLVADLDGRVVGHILFSPVTIQGEEGIVEALGLAPMAVEPELQGRGIGSLLVREGLEAARRGGHRAVVVLGHPSYYPRFGFLRASARGLRCEFPAPDEAFMVLELEPGALERISGTVRYLPEFSAA